MKKIVAALAGLSLCAAAATAEGITFQSWGRGLWNVIANGQEDDGKGGYDDTIVSGLMQSWGPWGSPRTAIKARGDSDNIGYALDVYGNGSGFGMGDDAHIYVKPIEQITAYLGKTDENVLRGDVCLPLWGWDRIGAVGVVDEEGWTFADYLDIGNGASIIVTPIEGLTIGTAVTLPDDSGADIGVVWGGAKGGDQTNMGGRYVAAYSIEGIGTIKAAFDTRRKHVRGVASAGKTVYYVAQADGTPVADDWYDDHTKINADGTVAIDLSSDDAKGYSIQSIVGKSRTGVDGDVMEIGVAFDLVAVENLFASVGARIPTDGNCVLVTAGANYTLDALGIHALVGALINSYDKDGDDGAVGIKGAVGVDYTLENGIGFFGEFQLATDNWMVASSGGDIDDLNVTFGVGVTKGFSNGVMGIAFEGSTTGNRYTEEDDAFGFEVPVKFEYWF